MDHITHDQAEYPHHECQKEAQKSAETKMNPWITMKDIAAKMSTSLELHGGILAEECRAQIAGGQQKERAL